MKKIFIPGEVICNPPEELEMTLQKNLSIFVRQSSWDIRSKWHTKERKLLDYLLVYNNSGYGHFVLDSTTYQLKPNSLFLIPPNHLHSMYGESLTMELGYIHFDLLYDPARSHWDAMIPGGVVDLTNFADLIHPPIELANIESYYGLLFNGNTPAEISRLIRHVIFEHKREKKHTFKQHALMLEIIAEIIEINTKSLRNKKAYQLYNQAAQYLNSNASREVNFKDLAKLINISESYLRKIFQQYRKCNPKTYHQWIRINKACELLTYSDLNISEIAEALGFQNIHSFSRTFKNVMSVSPMNFRSPNTNLNT